MLGIAVHQDLLVEIVLGRKRVQSEQTHAEPVLAELVQNAFLEIFVYER
jgi:hypothetical protein